jgi:hypothetical protein
MNWKQTIFLLLMLCGSVFAINPNVPFVQPDLMDSNTMGTLLVTEWAFGSIDIAFLVLAIIISIIMLKYAVPISVILISIMGMATVFAMGFNSIIAWGILIAGILAISLMVVINLLLKTQY